MTMLPGMGDFDPPDEEPPRLCECGNEALDGETVCAECKTHLCEGCWHNRVRVSGALCDECRAVTCATCEERERMPGLDLCRECAVSRADSLALDLVHAGEDLAKAHAKVANLTAEIEELRTERQTILDALHNHETRVA